VAVLAVVALFACGRAAPPERPSNERGQKEKPLIRLGAGFIDSSRLGTKLGTDGGVSEETATFTEGEPVYLTLNLHDSPPGLQTHAVWLDANDKELAKERHQMNGAKLVTFAMRQRLAPGHYRVEGYWGGNLAADKPFDVVAKKKKG
jgi:hypothetical protein